MIAEYTEIREIRPRGRVAKTRYMPLYVARCFCENEGACVGGRAMLVWGGYGQ